MFANRLHYKDVSVFSVLMLFLMFPYNGSINAERVVCGFSTISTKRSGEYGFKIADIPTTICTHVVYDHMEIDMFSSDVLFRSNDVQENAWKQLTELRRTKPDLKLLASIRSPFIQQLAAEEDSRGTLIENMLQYMEKLQLDGIELLWSGIFGPDEAFFMLLEELKTRFIAAGHPTWEVIVFVQIDDGTLDYARLCRLVDYVHVLGFGERKPTYRDNNSPPMAKATFDIKELKNITLERALQYWIDNSCPANKIVLGALFMAQTFTTVHGPMKTGEELRKLRTLCSITEESAACSYVELCQKFSESEWTMGWDDREELAPHAFQGDRWVAYENEVSVGRKGEIAKRNNLAGVYVVGLETDDYRNKCGTLFPLTKALSRSFKSTTVTTL